MAAEKQSKRRRLIRWLAGALLVVGIALISTRPLTDQVIKRNEQQTLSSLTVKKIKKNQTKKGQFDFSKVKSMDPAKAVRARVQEVSAIAAMAVPSVKLYLPVCRGLSGANMATGGCTMRSDQVMGQGNYPLAGHYMTAKGALFSPLEQVKTGALVYLTDLQHVYTYRIYMKRVVDPSSVWLVNDTNDKIVTLITCADGGANRWAIRGNLIKTAKATKQNLQVFKLKND
ncbi:MAG: class A sortase [Lactobacillus sp.]|jgi:sortase A|nr:class A sortase [Lactobacillus sp.]